MALQAMRASVLTATNPDKLHQSPRPQLLKRSTRRKFKAVVGKHVGAIVRFVSCVPLRCQPQTLLTTEATAAARVPTTPSPAQPNSMPSRKNKVAHHKLYRHYAKPAAASRTTSRLLELPGAIRNMIYDILYPLDMKSQAEMKLSVAADMKPSRNLSLTCRQLYNETARMQRESYRAFWLEHPFEIDIGYYCGGGDCVKVLWKLRPDLAHIPDFRNTRFSSRNRSVGMELTWDQRRRYDAIDLIFTTCGGNEQDRKHFYPDIYHDWLVKKLDFIAVAVGGEARYLLRGSAGVRFTREPFTLTDYDAHTATGHVAWWFEDASYEFEFRAYRGDDGFYRFLQAFDRARLEAFWEDQWATAREEQRIWESLEYFAHLQNRFGRKPTLRICTGTRQSAAPGVAGGSTGEE